MRLYRFSPISDKETAQKALEHVHDGLRKLSRLVAVEEELPINTLKLFAHYNTEYTFLKNWVDELGTNEDEPSPTSYYVKPHQAVSIQGDVIKYVGIRVADPYRSQVGCGDYVVADFEFFKRKYLGKSEFIREVTHPRYEMLELFHPDVDVLGYIVKE